VDIWRGYIKFGSIGIALGEARIGNSKWTRKTGNLRLTSDTLRLVTLLLAPMNFWAIDGLGLWGNIGGWLIVAIASFLLTNIIIYFDKKFSNYISKQWISIAALNLLGLSYLQYGWKFSGFPILAIYLGVIGTAIATIYQNQIQGISETTEVENQTNTGDPLTGIVIVIYALIILLARGIFVANVDITKLGLALGISGWILLKNNISDRIQRKLFVYIGLGLVYYYWVG